MACELDDLFNAIRSRLPDEWFITDMNQRGDGWHVTVGKFDDEMIAWPRIDTKAGLLTKAMSRMVDELDKHNAQTKEA